MTGEDKAQPSDEVTLVVDPDAPDEDDPGTPPSVGRYLLLEQIGEGGMGTVYSAFDPELERTVAIKLMYASGSADRLRREAQAIARVSHHPNVISVHDVGYFEFGPKLGVFMVMELIDGLDLDAWVTQEQRTWREVIGVFAQAGRGLEAAHAEGVVHRDFKPSNVLIDRRGRVHVLDFGLARGVEQDAPPREDPGPEAATTLSSGESPSSDSGTFQTADSGSRSRSAVSPSTVPGSGARSVVGAGSDLLSRPLTRHGAIMGTPRFMSPEQHRTSVVDARSDQYSFCLALYIALYNKRPFERYERKLDLLAAAKEAGINDWDGPGVPDHVEQALRRGLDPKPDLRFPDMGALVRALDNDPSIRRRRRLASAGVVTTLAAILAAGLGWNRHAVSACEDQSGWIGEAWGPAPQRAVEAAFAAVDRPYAATALAQVHAELDGYAQELGQTRAQLCLDEHRGSLEGSIATARMRCLDERREQLGAVVERLRDADATLVEHTVDVLSALPKIAPCAEIVEYADNASVDPKLRAQIERDLFGLRLTAAQGREQQALDELDPVIARARELGDPHTLTLVLAHGGEMVGSARRQQRAEELLSEAVLLAERHGEHDLSIDALTSLTMTTKDLRGRWDDAERTLDLAEAKYQREPGGRRGDWYFHYLRGGLHIQHSRWDEALAESLIAIEGVRAEGSAFELAKVLQATALEEVELGKIDEAKAHVSESIEIRARLYGLDHPNLMYPYRTLSRIAVKQGEFADAIAHLDRVIELGRRHHGHNAPGLVEPHNEKARIMRRLGRYEQALAIYDESRRLRAVNADPTSEILRLESQVLLRLRRPERALEAAEDALDRHREELGPDEQVPWLRARFVMHRGEALLALGRHDEALIDFERAAELRAAEKRDGLLIRIWTDEGACRLAQGQREGAAKAYERARAHMEADHETDLRTQGQLYLGLAKLSDDPSASRAWADKAIAAFEDHGGDDDLADEVRDWIANE
ncbi:Serine/threonine-protein kinase PknB [Enhygromyxa salina]|uniref:Serine/threonine-protein kinase PknB n=1 Tax=Enhygromyxa salina TaxID=215803 RepID=A0A2S9XK26_9BACT|nr:tetratricopeptide repeat protein [Enhygromyxa salina]PRP93187.1 Serine/threonine-protein kinase PknB [Enhygromyxa salina]